MRSVLFSTKSMYLLPKGMRMFLSLKRKFFVICCTLTWLLSLHTINAAPRNFDPEKALEVILLECFTAKEESRPFTFFVYLMLGIIEKHKEQFVQKYGAETVKNFMKDLQTLVQAPQNPTFKQVKATLEKYKSLIPKKVSSLGLITTVNKLNARLKIPKKMLSEEEINKELEAMNL